MIGTVLHEMLSFDVVMIVQSPRSSSTIVTYVLGLWCAYLDSSSFASSQSVPMCQQDIGPNADSIEQRADVMLSI